MGLDNFASRTEEIGELSEEDILAFKNENMNLCEGLFTEGEASFRGKVYANVVLEITGISLFEYWIPPKTVYEMWQAFENCDPEEFSKSNSGIRNSDSYSINELRKYFKVCAERKLGLVGVW